MPSKSQKWKISPCYLSSSESYVECGYYIASFIHHFFRTHQTLEHLKDILWAKRFVCDSFSLIFPFLWLITNVFPTNRLRNHFIEPKSHSDSELMNVLHDFFFAQIVFPKKKKMDVSFRLQFHALPRRVLHCNPCLIRWFYCILSRKTKSKIVYLFMTHSWIIIFHNEKLFNIKIL